MMMMMVAIIIIIIITRTIKMVTRPCEQGNWDTWIVLDPWNEV